MLISESYNPGCEISVNNDLDQTLLRITNCAAGGGSVFDPIAYELPQGLPVNAPLDATKIQPGEPVTLQPAPAEQVIETAAADPAKKTWLDWAKENKLLIGGALVAAYLIYKNKKR